MIEMLNGQNKFVCITRDFLQRTQIVNQINTPFIEVFYRLKDIESKSHANNVSFEQLTGCCYELVQRLPIPLMDVDVTFLLRCRPPYEDNGVIYSKASDLSYNPIIDLVKKGRFNIEKEPVFYASVPSLCKAGNPALSAVLEANKRFSGENKYLTDQFATVSRWDLKRKFVAINFSLFAEAEENNISVKQMNSLFYEQISRSFTQESLRSFIFLCHFMSEKAANKTETDSGYLITNAFKKALEDYYGVYIQAILYSSSMTEHNGLNIAVNKRLIDNGDIEFHGACVYKLQSHPYKKIHSLFPTTNYARPDCYGNFELEFKNVNRIWD